MATPSTGIVVNFNGNAASEVTELQWTFGGSMPQGRNTTWVPNFGTATIGTIGSNVSSALRGVRAPLVVTGGGCTLSTMAVCTGVSIAAELNGITRYTVSFEFVESTEYPF